MSPQTALPLQHIISRRGLSKVYVPWFHGYVATKVESFAIKVEPLCRKG